MSASITCDCGAALADSDAYAEHLGKPDRLCWAAISLRVDTVLRDLKGNRINYTVANARLTFMMKFLYGYGEGVSV